MHKKIILLIIFVSIIIIGGIITYVLVSKKFDYCLSYYSKQEYVEYVYQNDDHKIINLVEKADNYPKAILILIDFDGSLNQLYKTEIFDINNLETEVENLKQKYQNDTFANDEWMKKISVAIYNLSSLTNIKIKSLSLKANGRFILEINDEIIQGKYKKQEFILFENIKFDFLQKAYLDNFENEMILSFDKITLYGKLND